MLEIYNEELNFISQDFEGASKNLGIEFTNKLFTVRKNLIDKGFILNEIKTIAKAINSLRNYLFKGKEILPHKILDDFNYIMKDKKSKTMFIVDLQIRLEDKRASISICHSIIFLALVEQILLLEQINKTSIVIFNSLMQNIGCLYCQISNYDTLMFKEFRRYTLQKNNQYLEEKAQKDKNNRKRGGENRAQNRYGNAYNFVINKYKAGRFKSMRDAARRIVTELNEEKNKNLTKQLSPDNLFDTVYKWIRKHSKTQKQESNN